MSVVSVREKYAARTASDKGETREYGRTFLVQVNSHRDDAKVVVRARGIPTLRTPYATDTGYDDQARVRQRTPKQLDDLWWEVAIQYSTESQNADGEKPHAPSDLPYDPFDWPIIFRWGHQSTLEPMEQDADGNPIVNSVGDPFDPPLETEVYRSTCSITRNETWFMPDWARQFCGKVSSTRFLGFGEKQARCTGIQTSDQQEYHWIKYFRVTYDFVFDENMWIKKVLDRGPRFFQLINNKRCKVLDRDARGVATGKIVLLDAFGRRVDVTQPVIPAENGPYGGNAGGGGVNFHYLKFAAHGGFIDFGKLTLN